MQLQIFTVDAFSDRPLGGNPAAIVPLQKQEIDSATMQKIATEMNLSETTYVRPLEVCSEGEQAWTNCARFSLRWFTPALEVPLCGHATLATAHAVFHCLGNKRTQIEFETLSGILTVKRKGPEGDILEMDLPANPPEPLSSDKKTLLQPLVEACITSLKSQVQEVRYNPTLKYLFIRLKDSVTRETFEKMQPNFSEIASVHDGSIVKCISISVAADKASGYNVFSRFLAPWFGVDEDPVCGSAHTVLGPYWTEQLGMKEILCRQCSKRGGDVRVTMLEGGRVAVAGKAATVITGIINI